MPASSFQIWSFYTKNVAPRVPEYQKAVFLKFGFKVDYVTNENFSHGDFLNYVCHNHRDVDYLIVFDVDCIPVSSKWIEKLLADLKDPQTIAGAAQTANHLQDGKNLYVSPFFFGVSTAYLKDLAYPDMRMTDFVDAGQNLTDTIRNNGGKIIFWWPTKIEEDKWSLYDERHKRFGPGTTYDDLVYHAFFSRYDQSDRFVKKCKSVLGFFDKMRFIKWPRAIRYITRLTKIRII